VRSLGSSKATTVDVSVGIRVRERRVALGLTGPQLAQLIGVSYQQAHKYERGTNRISAGRLYEIAKALHTPLAHFYEGLDEATIVVAAHERTVLEIARHFVEIPNEKLREAFGQLVRALAGR
jgi:transcriptional regulator with XRE-family HTH domain